VGKIAFLFPGQGSQRVGMGADILESRSDIFDRYLGAADEATGLPIRRYCLEGPLEELTRTEVAQPALFSISLAVLELAREDGLTADFVAGHSLGEYTAAVASGAISSEVGIQLVARRGRLMADVQSSRPGAMAAIIGLSAERVRELCERASGKGLVVPANLNTPTQIVCSGEEPAIVELLALAEAEGAEKAVRLQVGAAFHSPLMEPVQAELREAMSALAWTDPSVPLVGNASGALRTTGAEVNEALVEQIASPVRWVDCVQTMVSQGCDTFLELGSGRVLSGLVRQVEPEAETFSADGPKKLRNFAQRHTA
jgi:[acyl-carrier-protein] S-malonyltransferase